MAEVSSFGALYSDFASTSIIDVDVTLGQMVNGRCFWQKKAHPIVLWVNSCIFGLSYNIADISHDFSKKCAALLHHSEDVNDLIIAAKCCRLMRGLVAKDDQLQHVKKTIKVQRNACIDKLAKLLSLTPLEICCKHGLFEEAVKHLAEGEPIEPVSEYASALFSAAMQKQHIGIALQCVELGVTDFPCNKEWLLVQAIAYKNSRAAICIIKSGLDLAQHLFLHLACEQGLPDVVRTLLEHGCDPLTRNTKQELALHIPLLRDLDPREVDHFYCKLFEEFPALVRVIKSQGTRVCFTQGSKLFRAACVEDAKQYGLNPFELALLLADEDLAHTLAPQFTKAEFLSYRAMLSKKYPTTNLELIDFCPYEISREHFRKTSIDFSVDAPTADISLDTFVQLFRTFNFNDPTHINFFDLAKYNLTDIKCVEQDLAQMMLRIKEHAPFVATPKEATPQLSYFYKTIEDALKNVLLKIIDSLDRRDRVLQDPYASEETKREHIEKVRRLLDRCFGELFNAMNLCGTVYFTTSVRLYLAECKEIKAGYIESLYELLASFREILFESLFQSDPQSQHIYTNLLYYHGAEYGLRTSSIFRGFFDIFNQGNLREVCQKFNGTYTVKMVVKECLLPKMTEAEFRNAYIDWHKKNMPKSWRKVEFDAIESKATKLIANNRPHHEIVALLDQYDIALVGDESYMEAIGNERVYSYLHDCVFNMQKGGSLSLYGLSESLIKPGVLTSCYPYDESQPPTLFSRIKGGSRRALSFLFRS